MTCATTDCVRRHGYGGVAAEPGPLLELSFFPIRHHAIEHTEEGSAVVIVAHMALDSRVPSSSPVVAATLSQDEHSKLLILSERLRRHKTPTKQTDCNPHVGK